VRDEPGILAPAPLPAAVDHRRTAGDVTSVRRHDQRELGLVDEGRSPRHALVDVRAELRHDARLGAQQLMLERDEPPASALVAGGELRHLSLAEHVATPAGCG
jgi:hypothetical protein